MFCFVINRSCLSRQQRSRIPVVSFNIVLSGCYNLFATLLALRPMSVVDSPGVSGVCASSIPLTLIEAHSTTVPIIYLIYFTNHESQITTTARMTIAQGLLTEMGCSIATLTHAIILCRTRDQSSSPPVLSSIHQPTIASEVVIMM
jgi:hypothetical protein